MTMTIVKTGNVMKVLRGMCVLRGNQGMLVLNRPIVEKA